MPRAQHIDHLLKSWAYQPGNLSARRVKGADGRELLQMRVDLGVLQLEVDGRPDGARPGDRPTYFHHLLDVLSEIDNPIVMTEEQCEAIDRELVQFYHRRICWLSLREFRRAQRDAEHTLSVMDFCAEHGPEQAWILSHEQYRPFVLFHRVQAMALADLEETGPAGALESLENGLSEFERLLSGDEEGDESWRENELVRRLLELRQAIREHYELGPSLAERLAKAVANEDYELAAQLRDEIAKLDQPN